MDVAEGSVASKPTRRIAIKDLINDAVEGIENGYIQPNQMDTIAREALITEERIATESARKLIDESYYELTQTNLRPGEWGKMENFSLGLEIERILGITSGFNTQYRTMNLAEAIHNKVLKSYGRNNAQAERPLLPVTNKNYHSKVELAQDRKNYSGWSVHYEELRPVPDQYTNPQNCFPGFREAMCQHEFSCGCEAEDANFPTGLRGGVEVVSRVFKGTDLGKGIMWEETTRVMHALKYHCYDYEPAGRRNAVTGVHVHVGLGPGRTFTLEALRNIAAVVVHFERALDGLHEPQRNDWQFRGHMQDWFNVSSSQLESNRKAVAAFINRKHNTQRRLTFNQWRNMSNYDILSRIIDVESAEELVRVMQCASEYDNSDKGYKVNFREASSAPALYTENAKRKGTVEFRQLGPTTDAMRITMWAELVVNIVAVACSYRKSSVLLSCLNACPGTIECLLFQFLRMTDPFSGPVATYWYSSYCKQRKIRKIWKKAAFATDQSSLRENAAQGKEYDSDPYDSTPPSTPPNR